MSQFQPGERVQIGDVPGIMPDYIRGCTATVLALVSAADAAYEIESDDYYEVLVDLRRYEWASGQPRAHVLAAQHLQSTQVR